MVYSYFVPTIAHRREGRWQVGREDVTTKVWGAAGLRTEEGAVGREPPQTGWQVFTDEGWIPDLTMEVQAPSDLCSSLSVTLTGQAKVKQGDCEGEYRPVVGSWSAGRQVRLSLLTCHTELLEGKHYCQKLICVFFNFMRTKIL